MLGKHWYFLLGIFALGSSYIFFTNQQYLSPVAMLGIFAFAIIALAIFLLPHLKPHLAGDKKTFLIMLSSVVVLAVYEYVFNLVPPGGTVTILKVAGLVTMAMLISVGGIYLLARNIAKRKGYAAYAYALIGIIVIATFAYSVMYVINQVQWNGVDEVAYNYYAAYLFVHGQNPYTASMAPILSQRNIFPTVQMNGTYEYAYDYPALSFLAWLPIPLLGITSFFSFVWLIILFSVASCFLLYYKSGQAKALLIPIGGWLVLTYTLVGVATQYLAVPVLLLMAYCYRSKPIISGVLIGLASSAIQLAWFAAPFFFVLMYREHGRKAMLHDIAAAVLVFAVINAPFIAAYPASFRNIINIFSFTKLPFYGTNIMQFIVAFFPTAYWFPEVLTITVFFVMLALYYFYTHTLKQLIAIVPMMIFFLSWRNISIYGIPFIPLLLATYYWEGKEHKDALHKKFILPAVVCLVVVFALLGIVAHMQYESSAGLRIAHIYPIISVNNGYGGTQLGLLGFRVIMNNTLGTYQPTSFYMISRSPNDQGYVLGSQLNQSAPNGSTNFTITYQLPLINNSTKVFIAAFSNDYITARTVNFSSLKAPPQMP